VKVCELVRSIMIIIVELNCSTYFIYFIYVII